MLAALAKPSPSTRIPDLTLTFTVLNTPDANAFALPSAYHNVIRSLIELADKEAPLAGGAYMRLAI